MIELDISPEVVSYAKNKLSRVELNKDVGLSKFGSERERILVGYIGERLVMNHFGITKDSDTYNFDLMSNKGKRLEVKTISCKFKPKPEYLCTVNSHNLNGVHKQYADFYIFMRILNDYSKGWILGYISCDDFFKYGEFVSKGKDFGKFKFVKANATVLEISKLNKID